jgi:hypothetical protein
MPSIAQLGFRKLSLMASIFVATSSADFPLFLTELRVLLSFLFNTQPNIHPWRGGADQG